MSHIPVISTIDGSCEYLSLGSAASCASLDHLDGNGGPDSVAQKVKILASSSSLL